MIALAFVVMRPPVPVRVSGSPLMVYPVPSNVIEFTLMAEAPVPETVTAEVPFVSKKASLFCVHAAGVLPVGTFDHLWAAGSGWLMLQVPFPACRSGVLSVSQ